MAQSSTDDRYYGTGRRKTSIARVWIKPGKGTIVCNGVPSENYFNRPTLERLIRQPFALLRKDDQYDVWCTLKGGGVSSQAGALQLGIARALAEADDKNRPPLRRNGFLTRDPRMVERKKYGHAGARKRFQFSKR
jgi:small subunit ribosomal protein S9